jgi:transposase
MERLPMSKILEILRLRWLLALSVRQTSLAVGVSTGGVSNTTSRAEAAGLTWEVAAELDERELEERVYGVPAALAPGRPEPDPLWVHLELKRPGVTLELLHLEYKAEHQGQEPYEYTAFCNRYRKWLKARGLTMRQEHRAGERVFVDFSGKKPRVVDRTTGASQEVELFVAVLGASNFTYAEATASQKIGDWLRAHVHAFAYFGGTPKVAVPDQLRSAVTVPCRYEPTIQRTYAELGRHYEMAIVPARPRKPKDKSKAEVGVQVAQRWVLARLRNETFFSLEELNARIRELLEDLNARPMKRYGGLSRRDLFERLDRPALRSLPSEPFVHAEWLRAKVHDDYHVQIDHHYYSVPYALVGEHVEVRCTATTIEAFHKGHRVASHVRSYEKYRYTTDPSHLPPNHREWLATDPGELQAWAATVGPFTEAVVRRVLERDPHFGNGLRSAQGLRRVCEKYGKERTEKACAIALQWDPRSYKPVERILRMKREEQLAEQLARQGESHTPIEHDQVRGPDYFTN